MDSITKHTPGPWEIRDTGTKVGEKLVLHIHGEKNALVASWVWGIEDARLISAAPDLLEACRLALVETDLANAHFKGVSPATPMLKAAIAKAEGRTP